MKFNRCAAVVALTAFLAIPGVPTTTAQAADRNTVTIGTTCDLTTLDLGQFVVFGADVPILDNVYDSLASRNRDGSSEPAIATEWSVSDDGLAWTLILRKGVRFNNGTVMTAKDVAYSLERYRDKQYTSNTAALWSSYLDHVKIVDDYTVILRLKKPTPLLMQGAPFYSPILSADVAAQKSAADLGRTVATAIGTGPYRIVEWVKDERVVLEAFPGHWRGAPAIKRVVFRPIPKPPPALRR